MNRGCVAVGEIQCDNCHRFIEAGQRYLVVDKEKGGTFHYCVECSVARGDAAYVKEKGEEVLSFFPAPPDLGTAVPITEEPKKPKVRS